jgi:hypothetical protein
MSLTLSSQVMESIGFRRIDEGELIVAAFHSIHVYEVQGFTVDKETVLVTHGAISGTAYTVAVGSSVNQLSRALVGDDLVADEVAWVKEHWCIPPYVLVHFGPTSQHSCGSGHIKEEESTLVTFDSFASAKAELRSLESRVLPSLVTALTCAFSSSENHIRFQAVSREVFGITPDGVVLHDIRFELKASAYVSRKLPMDSLQATVDRTTSLAARINPKVSRFFHLALEEDDPLKRFLYFFLSIEIETHAAFSSIDHSAHIARLINSEDRVRAVSTSFFEAQRERWTTLNDRFVWCALCIWTHVSDSDIEEFKRLKKIRDDIAHGSIAEPPAESVSAVERLAVAERTSRLTTGSCGRRR